MSETLPDWFNRVESLSDISAREIDPASWVDDLDAKDFVHRFLTTLSPREEQLLRLRYGIGGHGEHTTIELAVHYHVTPSRIRQLEQKAIRKLRYRARHAFPGRRFAPGIAVPTQIARANSAPPIVATQSRTDSSKPAYTAPHPKRRSTDHSADTWTPYDPANVRRTRLYRDWLAQRDAARPATDLTHRSTPAIDSRRPRLLVVSAAWALAAAVSAGLWQQTLGSDGRSLFATTFGESGQMVRALVYVITFATGPIFSIMTWHSCTDLLTSGRSGDGL